MIPLDTRPAFVARRRTTFLNTTNKCVEVFFKASSVSSDDLSIVSIIAISETLEEKVLAQNDGSEPTTGWNRLFAELPAGINRVVIEGRRSWNGVSSLSVDDVAVLPCSTFGKLTQLV